MNVSRQFCTWTNFSAKKKNNKIFGIQLLSLSCACACAYGASKHFLAGDHQSYLHLNNFSCVATHSTQQKNNFCSYFGCKFNRHKKYFSVCVCVCGVFEHAWHTQIFFTTLHIVVSSSKPVHSSRSLIFKLKYI